ncbi:hypothetical protein [Okeania sp. SIO1H2]|nr:hypothetical protein [Okeania sp. SIO1H2]
MDIPYEKIAQELKKIYPAIMTKIRFNIKSGSIGVIKPEFSATNGTGL